MTQTIAEFRIPTSELRDDIPFYTKVLGMRMDMIYPGGRPAGSCVFRPRAAASYRKRRDRGSPGALRILTDDPDGFAGWRAQSGGPEWHAHRNRRAPSTAGNA